MHDPKLKEAGILQVIVGMLFASALNNHRCPNQKLLPQAKEGSALRYYCVNVKQVPQVFTLAQIKGYFCLKRLAFNWLLLKCYCSKFTNAKIATISSIRLFMESYLQVP